ncbi:LysM peptidoglycan-binding domain-containing protein [Kitasatospora arboriphila]
MVQDGDTLDAIAQTLQLPGGWPALYQANQDTVGDNPDLIFAGQVLRLP